MLSHFFVMLAITTYLGLGSLVSIGSAETSENLLAPSKKYDDVRVAKVLSADSFILASGEKIKLIGLVSPEPPKKKKVERDAHGFIIEEKDPTISIEQQSYDFTRDLIEGKKVRLEFDAEKNSDDFRTFAYVFVDNDLFVNAEILRQGYADLKILPPNTKYAQALREAYQEARREKRGLRGE